MTITTAQDIIIALVQISEIEYNSTLLSEEMEHIRDVLEKRLGKALGVSIKETE